jgi:hypothetical protein
MPNVGWGAMLQGEPVDLEESPAWPLGHKPSCDRPSCALSRPEPIKLTVPLVQLSPATAMGLFHGRPARSAKERGP